MTILLMLLAMLALILISVPIAVALGIVGVVADIELKDQELPGGRQARDGDLERQLQLGIARRRRRIEEEPVFRVEAEAELEVESDGDADVAVDLDPESAMRGQSRQHVPKEPIRHLDPPRPAIERETQPNPGLPRRAFNRARTLSPSPGGQGVRMGEGAGG